MTNEMRAAEQHHGPAQHLRASDTVEDTAFEALGYPSSYRRVLSTLGTICIVISLTSPLSAVLITAFYQVNYGGYWGLTWGWFIPSIVFVPQVLAVCELVSSMPINGAFYWWTAALAPPKASRFLAFVSGWTNFLALLTSVTSFSFALAAMLAQGIGYIHPGWVATNAQTMGIAFGLVAAWASLAAFKLEKISLVYVGCSVVILVHLLVFLIGLPVTHAVQQRPWANGKDVFGSFNNSSDWPTPVAVPFTWFTALWVNSSWAAPAYVVEGTHDARRSAPRAILQSYGATAGMGMVICLIAAFCITDMPNAVADPSGYPLLAMLFDHWGLSANAAFILIVAAITCIGGSAVLVTYSFQVAAFARDGGLPFAKTISHVNSRVNMPVYAILAMSVGTCFVLLFSLSAVAKEIIYSLAVMAQLMTWSLPNLMRLFAGDRWAPGPWNYGRFSKPVFAWAFVSQIYLIIMEAFPSSRSYTAATFNYNWVVAFGAIFLSIALYFAIGKNFSVDLDALARYRQEQIEGLSITKTTTEDNNNQIALVQKQD